MSEVLDSPAPEAVRDITTLPPADRAALVLNSTKTEADLKQLAESLKAITLVNSPAGREQAHALAMTARTARTTITKVGKAAREDATKFSAAVIAEEKRLIGLISEQEDRVLGLRDAWDAAEAARKEAEAQKERDRIAAHHAVIERIKSLPRLAREARTSAMALQMLEKLTAIDTRGLEEFADAAHSAKLAADEQINDIVDAKQAAEAEQARIKAEQEEAARLLAEQQAELLAMQAKMKAQQEELDRQAAAMARVAAELDARKASEVMLSELPAAVLADALTTVLCEDPRDALAQVMAGTPQPVEQEPALIQQPATVDEMHQIGNSIMYGQVVDATIDDKTINNTPEQAPSAINMVNTIAFEYGVEPATAIRWLAERSDEFKYMNTITEVTP